jgi:hypothetical protein
LRLRLGRCARVFRYGAVSGGERGPTGQPDQSCHLLELDSVRWDYERDKQNRARKSSDHPDHQTCPVSTSAWDMPLTAMAHYLPVHVAVS